jgi:hypothetical protein
MVDDKSSDAASRNSQQIEKSRSITFRLNSSILDELQREADQKEVSLNVLVNQILKRYSDWDRFENKIGMMPVPKKMLRNLIDKCVITARNSGIKDVEPYRDEIVKQAAEIAFGIMKDTVLFMKKDYNLWTVLAVLQEYMKVSGVNSDHRIEDGRKHVFIIQHELGEHWSLFTKELLRLIFENLAKVRAQISITSNTTRAEVILEG